MEGEEEPKGEQRNGCDMSHEIGIKLRSGCSGVDWLWVLGACIVDVALGDVLLVKKKKKKWMYFECEAGSR